MLAVYGLDTSSAYSNWGSRWYHYFDKGVHKEINILFFITGQSNRRDPGVSIRFIIIGTTILVYYHFINVTVTRLKLIEDKVH